MLESRSVMFRPLNIVLLLGSVRDGRMAERVGRAVKAAAEAKKMHVTLFGLPLPFSLPSTTPH